MIYVEEADSGNETDQQENEMKCAEVHINRLGKLNLKCLICDEFFKSFEFLKNHLQDHFNVTPVQCFTCNLAFSTFDVLVSHSNQCTSKPEVNSENPSTRYVEIEAENESQTITSLHKITEKAENVITLQLDELEVVSFSDNFNESNLDDENGESNVWSPIYGHIDENDNAKAAEDTLGISMSLISKDISLEDLDVIWEKAFNSDQDDDKATQPIKEKVLTTSRRGAPKEHACTHCERVFKTVGGLKSHIVVHTNERPYSCHICNKTLKHASTYREHMTAHKGELRFQCDECGKQYTTYSAYKCHVKRHSNELLYQCQYCARKFKKKADMILHERIHTDERPFECKVCSKSFRRIATLHQHSLLHTGQKPFVCTSCGLGFAQKPALARHVKNHPCDVLNANVTRGKVK